MMKCPECNADINPAKDDGVHSYERTVGKEGIEEITKVICHKAYQAYVKTLRAPY